MGIGLAIVGMMLLAIEPVLTARRGFLVKRVQVRRILACLILGGALFGMLQAFSDTGRFFLHSAGGDATSHWEQFTRGQLPFVLKEAAWLGFGTGTLSQGLAYVSGGRESVDFASRESEGVGVEYGLAKVAWELGVVGLALFLILWTRILWSLWKNLLLTRDLLLKGVARALAIFVLLVFVAFLKGHYYLGDGTTLALCWFAMGLAFSFRRLERIERMRLKATEPVRSGSTRPLGFRQDIRRALHG
jgi:hypothetical protein